MDFLKFVFKGLYNNDTILEGRKRKWWIAVIFFLVSLVLVAVPTIVSGSSVNGGDIVRRENNSALDLSLAMFAEDKPDCIINAEHKMVCTNLADAKTYENSDGVKLLTVYNKPLLDPKFKEGDSKILSDFINTEHFKLDEAGKRTVIPVSYLVFTSTSVHLATFPLGKEIDKESKATMTFIGEYSKIDDFKFTTIYDDAASKDVVAENFAKFFDLSYKNIKMQNLLTTVGLYLLINTFVIFIINLALFIMSRGKQNPLSIITFFECTKMACFSALSPAILTLIVGFIFPQFASIAFILLMSMRTMWFGMKINRGVGTAAPQKPNNSPKKMSR